MWIYVVGFELSLIHLIKFSISLHFQRIPKPLRIKRWKVGGTAKSRSGKPWKETRNEKLLQWLVYNS